MQKMGANIDAKALGKVGVLFGGRSAEREVSIMSGNGVLQALRSRGVDAHLFDTGERSLADLAAEKFDRVFIALHGRFGEDGTMQGVLEHLGIPYTGSGVMASSICMDKIYTKKIWQSHGLSTPTFLQVQDESDLAALPAKLGLPLMLKAPHEGSTIGITKVTDPSQLASAFATSAKFGDEVLAEEFIQGRELTVTVLGKGKHAYALPIVEIVAPEGNYDYQNKYFTDVTQYFCPAEIADELSKKIQQLAVDAFCAVGCEGWGRVDILLRNSDNQPFLLEINTSPGMTGHSLTPIAARALGNSYEDLCLEILAQASLKMPGADGGKE